MYSITQMISKGCTILGVKIDVIELKELLDLIVQFCNGVKDKVWLVNNVNIHALNIAYKDKDFKEILNNSDVVFCDGYGVVLAAKILKQLIGQRMTPPDWIDDLFQVLTEHEKAVFFLGDEEKVVYKFTKRVKKKLPSLKIAGFHHGFFNTQDHENSEVIDKINNSKADVLLIGMGMPLQEKWAYENRTRLSVKAIISIGALFRWYSGVEKRAPSWLTNNGLEWLGRLVIQPKKIWKRYIVGNPLFFYRVVLEKITQ